MSANNPLHVAMAGAQVVHVHAFDDHGRETLDACAWATVVRAIRWRAPPVPVSRNPSATISADPRERLRVVAAWEDLPGLVTANQGEPGIVELCAVDRDRGGSGRPRTRAMHAAGRRRTQDR